ncbi:MAG: hypothetical protein HQL52_13575 [Magnetococcales bacterium]|nr:hypothetical protein [Magnetococcales bacterium]
MASVNDPLEIIDQAVERYRGDGGVLEAAIGALFIGQYYGWRVLRILHSNSTYRRYEKILGVQFKEACPERGKYAFRSKGLQLADELKSFWKVADSAVAAPNRRVFSE